ncbi:MAG: hypothetical protein R2792_11715 [Saprospiraceae bacterium]
MNNTNQTFFQFILQKHKAYILVAVLLSILGLVVATQSIQLYEKAVWVDPVISMVTLLFAIFLWFSSVRIAFEMQNEKLLTSLPKRLTIKFLFEGKIVMECRQAMLTDPSDIRAWGQQVGAQLALGRKLNFFPLLNILMPDSPERDAVSQTSFWHYQAVITLINLPVSSNNPSADEMQFDENLNNGKCMLWIPQYARNGGVSIESKWIDSYPLTGE